MNASPQLELAQREVAANRADVELALQQLESKIQRGVEKVTRFKNRVEYGVTAPGRLVSKYPGFASEHPWINLGICVAAGLIIGNYLASSSESEPN